MKTKFYKKDKDIFQERYTKKDNFLSLEVYKNINNNQANDVYVRCGDEKEGELVSMTDFLERLKL